MRSISVEYKTSNHNNINGRARLKKFNVINFIRGIQIIYCPATRAVRWGIFSYLFFTGSKADSKNLSEIVFDRHIKRVS